MEEILKRLGVPIENWIVSIFAAVLIVFYRVYEPDEPLSKRKTIRVVIMGLSSALLVPGLVVYWAKVQNPFLAAVITGLSVYCFEPIMEKAKSKLMTKIDKTDGSN
ncbi:hypothetical protein [Dyadobacter sp. CY323]|uniref:hypothetical protein n=1 Tax=Dyadobacter sp. CY323 TaxID=2907302 RepID=UPI001F2007BE|nr:hypothetical protein [Dyadobacter sp. CY323]MCE6987500.1 hypothetical protein [Dyadobacter sp. CY323]